MNAVMIAEILGLEDFDEKNLRACCPYHKEDTPSFIYSRKGHFFKCFGCQKSVDVIDVMMEKGNTFLEACKKLFDEAGIDYSFGEKNVRTKIQYKYPHDENHDMTPVKEYWNRRKISDETLDYLNIGADKKGNTAFKYYDLNDVLTMVKYRPSHTIDKKKDNKNWSQVDADTSNILFNMNRTNTSQPLLIVEGEGDCMSAIEAGYYNTVSIPFGAGNFKWIDECWDFLNQFNSIIVAADNDEPGKKMITECMYRLGTWRTKIVEYPKANGNVPLKDMNDILQSLGPGYVLNMIVNAKEIPLTSVTNFSDIDDIDVSDMDGIDIGIDPLDDALIKLFYGTLTILSGRPGSGKTSLIDQVIANCIDSGNKAWLYSKEMSESQTSNWLHFMIAGNRNLVEKTNSSGKTFKVVPFEKRRQINEYYDEMLYIYKDDESMEIAKVFESMESAVRKYGVKLVVIDNLMMLDLGANDENQNSAQTKLVNDLIVFSKKFNVATVLIAHPRKTQDANSDIEMYDIAGSSNIINLAMRSIGLRRTSEKEKQDPKSTYYGQNVVVTVMKDRILGAAGTKFGIYYDIYSRRFFTNYKEFDKQYGWDTNVYRDKIYCPVDFSPKPISPFG